MTAVIPHSLPAGLGVRKLHVTLKDAAGKRLERKVVEITGKGEAEVGFTLPPGYAGESVSVAAFVGEEYEKSLQHLQSDAVPVVP